MADTAQGARPQFERPLAPHLQIWRFTVTMAASITHRGTGMVLYGGSVLLAAWALALAFSPALFSAIAAFVASPLGFIVVAGYVWSLSFHLMNGLRHLYWDTGRGLGVKTAARTAWAVYIGSIILAAVILAAGYARLGA